MGRSLAVVSTLIALVAGFLAASPAQAAPVDCAAGSEGSFVGCWNNSDPDVRITLGSNVSISSRLSAAGGAKRTIFLNTYDITF